MNRGRRARSTLTTLAGVAFALAALLGACSSSSFAPRVELPQVALQWPFPPNPPKLVYVRSLTGFTARPNAGRSLRVLVVGKESADRNAFVLPVAVAVGGDGRIAVADMGRRCVHLYLPEAAKSGGTSGRYLQLTGSADEPLVSPVGLAFDDAQRLYLTDSAGRVFAFGAQGELLWSRRTAGDTPWQRPTGIAWSPATQLLYVVDTLAHRVFGLKPDGSLELSFGGRGEGVENFNFPTHLYRAADGTLFVTDTLNFRISAFDERGAPLGTFGRQGDGSGDLGMPKGVAADGDGVIYVADSLFDNVQLFDRAGKFLLTLGRRGTAPGEFWLPSGLYVSAGGELYVADTYNRRVQVFRIQEGYVASSF
ncbi:MAG: 6-bladed beta-propeller [Thermoanaerobaculia bacterium]